MGLFSQSISMTNFFGLVLRVREDEPGEALLGISRVFNINIVNKNPNSYSLFSNGQFAGNRVGKTVRRIIVSSRDLTNWPLPFQQEGE
jgi:hypothetical protein